MRAIDADALESDLFDADWTLDNDEHMVQDILRKQPTLDVVPARHGRWIQSKTVPAYHHCSLCKATHRMKMSCNVYVFTKYCPNCGAKMDLKE